MRTLYTGKAVATRRFGTDPLVITILDAPADYVDIEGTSVYVTVVLAPDIEMLRRRAKEVRERAFEVWMQPGTETLYAALYGEYQAYAKMLETLGAPLFETSLPYWKSWEEV